MCPPVNGPRPLVLVADNHDDTRSMLRTLLMLEGFDVSECDDGLAVLSAVEEQRPDVILLDGTLQGLDGLAVAERLCRADEAAARRVIFVSGRGGPEILRSVRAAGCEAFLLKPVNLDELLEAVRRVAARAGTMRG
jgi:CheY-like chemotaxis protein